MLYSLNLSRQGSTIVPFISDSEGVKSCSKSLAKPKSDSFMGLPQI
ncbi:MAG: hypothetical protein WCK98_05470 [bacterium]